MGQHTNCEMTDVSYTLRDLWVLGGLWVLVGQDGRRQWVLEDPEDPFLLEDLQNLDDPAHPDLTRETDVIIK